MWFLFSVSTNILQWTKNIYKKGSGLDTNRTVQSVISAVSMRSTEVKCSGPSQPRSTQGPPSIPSGLRSVPLARKEGERSGDARKKRLMTGDREALLRPASWCRAKWRRKGWARGLADRGVEDARRTSLPPCCCLELAWSLGFAKPHAMGLSRPPCLQRELRRVPAPQVRGEKSGCLLLESHVHATDLLYVLCQERKVMANLRNNCVFYS